MRGVKAIIFWAGIFLGITEANAAECPGSRDASAGRHSVPTDTAKHVRLSCTQKYRHRSAVRHSPRKAGKVARSNIRQVSVRAAEADKNVLKGGGAYRIGSPYKISGRIYTPKADPTYRAEGKASWYGGEFHGRLTANGEKFDALALSAAHPTLPLPSYVRVTNLENHRSLVVRLNDRGPYRNNRLIDLSVRAAKLLGLYDQGLAQVRVEYVGQAKLDGSDDAQLAATLRNEDASAVQVAAAAAPVRFDRTSPSSDDDGSSAAQCTRPGTNSGYPQPASIAGDRIEALNCKPNLLETKIAALWPSTTFSQKNNCVAELALNRP